jgi:hypothetical protein
MNHLSEEDLILIYYNEPEAGTTARSHLAGCAECREAAERLSTTLNSCYEWQAPEPDPELARGVWAAIAPQLDRPHLKTPGVRWRWPFLTLAAAAVLLLAFLAGRYSQKPTALAMSGLSTQAQRRILAISLADHLDRAEMLLTEVSNTDEPVDRVRAQDLVEEGRLMRQVLARQGESSTLAMVDEVERFLLEAANAPDGQTAALRERIAANSLLFKVRIIESNLRTGGQKI